ncbi:MAG TPA: hypothetical protein VHB79_08965 [Polyangiaceae bacterium]|nr:hypothetical protein [Polyangiaceae bacterium]
MRTEAWPTLARCGLVAALLLLVACPGKLSNKSEFEDYDLLHGDAGMGNEAGTAAVAAGTGNTAGSIANDACGDVAARIFLPSCGGTGCHSANAPQQGLDLVSPDVASRVVGKPAKQCLQTLADPQNPEQSLLYQKLLTKPQCGAQMPLARPALSNADIACVLSWIAAQ